MESLPPAAVGELRSLGHLKRSTPLIFVSVFAALYITWCLRPYFVGAELQIDSRLPSEAKNLVVEAHSEKQFNRRGFAWGSFFTHLIHPTLARLDSLDVKLIAPDEVALVVPGHKPLVLVIKDASGKWRRTDNRP